MKTKEPKLGNRAKKHPASDKRVSDEPRIRDAAAVSKDKSHVLNVRISDELFSSLNVLAGKRMTATGRPVRVSDIVREALEREIGRG